MLNENDLLHSYKQTNQNDNVRGDAIITMDAVVPINYAMWPNGTDRGKQVYNAVSAHDLGQVEEGIGEDDEAI